MFPWPPLLWSQLLASPLGHHAGWSWSWSIVKWHCSGFYLPALHSEINILLIPIFYALTRKQTGFCSRVDFLCHRNHRCIKGKTRCAESLPGLTHSSIPRVTGLYGLCSLSQLMFSSFGYELSFVLRVSELGGSRYGPGCVCTGPYLWISSRMWGLVCLNVWLCRSKQATPGLPLSFEQPTCNLSTLFHPGNARPTLLQESLQLE